MLPKRSTLFKALGHLRCCWYKHLRVIMFIQLFLVIGTAIYLMKQLEDSEEGHIISVKTGPCKPAAVQIHSPFPPRLQNLSKPANTGQTDGHRTIKTPFFDFILDDPDIVCNQYHLPVDSPEMMAFIKESKPLNCTLTGVVGVSEDVIFVKEEALPQVTCSFTELYRQDDYSYIKLKTVGMDSKGRYKLKYSDAVQVQCQNLTSGKNWSEAHIGLNKIDHVDNTTGWHKLPEGAIPLNVLIWAFDSTSKNNFLRKMVHSWDYMKHEMNGVLMDGYNIVKESTFSALCSLLTGYYTYSGTGKAYVEDRMTSETIFNLFSKHGYVTTYFEDEQNWGTFQHWGQGFRKQPTDHYNRPYMFERAAYIGHYSKCCFGQSCNNVTQKFIQEFWRTYQDKPKFALVMQGTYSHEDINDMDLIDLEFLSLLKWMNGPSEVSENTMIVIMGDHGHRSHPMTFTRQGTVELRRPLMYVVLPQWVEQRWPLPVANLKVNSKRLVTAMDLHFTIKDLLSFGNEDFSTMPAVLENLPWGLSMFKPMPKGRTCAMAKISDHYCACKKYEEVDVQDKNNNLVLSWMGKEVMKFLNRKLEADMKKCVNKERNAKKTAGVMKSKLTSSSMSQLSADQGSNGSFQQLCKQWELKRVERALQFVTDSPAAKGKGEAAREISYEIALVASPGESHFVATVTVDIIKKKTMIEERSISRLDWYSPFSKCIETICPKLEKFCHCGVNIAAAGTTIISSRVNITETFLVSSP